MLGAFRKAEASLVVVSGAPGRKQCCAQQWIPLAACSAFHPLAVGGSQPLFPPLEPCSSCCSLMLTGHNTTLPWQHCSRGVSTCSLCGCFPPSLLPSLQGAALAAQTQGNTVQSFTREGSFLSCFAFLWFIPFVFTPGGSSALLQQLSPIALGSCPAGGRTASLQCNQSPEGGLWVLSCSSGRRWAQLVWLRVGATCCHCCPIARGSRCRAAPEPTALGGGCCKAEVCGRTEALGCV